MTDTMTVAKTIHQQLFAMDRNLMWGLGFNSPCARTCNDGNPGLTFKVKGIKHKGFVDISLDEGQDLYNIEVYIIRKVKNSPEVKKTVKYAAISQFAEDLPGILEEYCY